jgi:DNA-binding XRE family transcriptional regulator
VPIKTKRVHKPRVEFWRQKPPGQLTPEESACVLVALEFMIARTGSMQALAYKMGIDRTCVRRAVKGKPEPGVAMALELARVVGVTVDDVLAGRFPPPGSCPHCGGIPEADAPRVKG